MRWKSLPHSDPKVRYFDNLIGAISIIYPLTGFAQVFKIWTEKTAAGVSLLTWGAFLIFTIPFLIYSFLIKDGKLALMWSLWVVVYVSVIAGVLVYG